MKIKIIYFIVFLVGLYACEKDKSIRNPYLGEVHFTYTINMDLPLYNALKTPMSTVFIPYGGIKGFFVTYNGSSYYAWEATCPNHNLEDCRDRLRCVSGSSFEFCEDTSKSYIYVKCPCGGTVYSLINGGAVSSPLSNVYPLLNYNVSISGNVLTVSN
nr:hypothetical protein [uncultured Capnocytophaga sp.]